MKKITAFILVAVLVISSVLFWQPGGEGMFTHEILAAEASFANVNAPAERIVTHLTTDAALQNQLPRGGYILAPTLFGLNGVDGLSNFVLRTPIQYVGNFPNITIDGEPAPNIRRENNNTFIITPLVPLLDNSLYVFRLSKSGEPDITWAFQTTQSFEILSTMPRHESTNVPVRTSIEVSFTAGPPDIAEHFSIYPNVEGRFITEGYAVIFLPTNPLAHGTLYTVTLSEGISLQGTSKVISTSHVFQFETEHLPDPTLAHRRRATISFSTNLVEFPSFAPPSVQFWAFGQDAESFSMDVYRFDDTASAIRAANQLALAPNWTWAAQESRFVDVSELTRIFSGSHTTNPDSWRAETFTLTNNLPPGFYVLNATSDFSQGQVIIQVTDLAVQVITDENMTLVWANDMNTGRPASGARVMHSASGRQATVSEYGIATLDVSVDIGEHMLITTTDGAETVVFAHSRALQSIRGGWSPWGWGWDTGRLGHNYYWNALQLDRTLFQRSDTVNVWGFVQNRHRAENITFVTATITEQTWWRAQPLDTLVRQNLPVQGSAFSGEIRLPNLDPGSYMLTVYHGDFVLSTTFFTVDDYVTPPYRFTVTADRVAIFAGDEVNFTARAEFFEGTPVPQLDLSYDFQGWDLNAPPRGQGRTDMSGNFEISASPTAADARVSGERRLTFAAEATLPEIGWVHQAASTRVFVNDINVRTRATRDGASANLEISVHNITLSRLNDGTAANWSDFLGTPRAAHNISVEIIEIYWERIRDGERFDSIRRQVVPRYRWEERRNTVDSFQMTTNAAGVANRDFTVANRENASYIARITTQDSNGRTITRDAFIGRDWTWFFWNAEDGTPFLDGANEDGYDIGDEVRLTVMSGAEPVDFGNFLFVTVQGGIMSYSIGRNPLVFNFAEEHVPNVTVFAYHFNGHTYTTGWQMSQSLRFNQANAELQIDITTDRAEYRPGDTVNLNLRVTDRLGNPIQANVNISLVDEALFALMDYNVDTLSMLFRNVDANLRLSFATHATFVSDGIEEDDAWEFLAEAEMDMAGAAPAPAMAMAADDAAAQRQALIRERFEDTAQFLSGRANSAGVISFTFELPHNITTWRVTASAISESIQAGNALSSVRVTQPMFLNYSLGSLFLTGDVPYVGISAFGARLTPGQNVLFEVWREDFPNDIRSATGVAFERVNIPLWEKTEEGSGAIIIYVTAGGTSDALRHPYQVVNSHRLVDIGVFYEVTPTTVFDINPGGLTNITFMDAGRGRFVSDLFAIRSASWRGGIRVEGLLAGREATRLLNEHFPDIRTFGKPGIDITEYQQLDGGIAILPYASSDLRTTVMALPFVLDEVNVPLLREYLLRTNGRNRTLALYGLAMLGEPVLLELTALANEPNVSLVDAVYLGLALVELGEVQQAERLYNSRIAPHVQRFGANYRIDVGGDRRELLEATTSAALLAARLGRPESLGLHSYAHTHRELDMIMTIERLKFISYMIENLPGEAASITYTLFGETITRELGAWRHFTLRIPAASFGEFRIISTTGDVSAVSIVRTPLEEIEAIESDVIITRQFFAAGSNTPSTTFNQGDLVRVEITVTYSPRSVEGSYVITDFLPAGLVHVPHSARFGENINNTAARFAWVRTEGQRITFFDHNRRSDRTATYFYYARVISPGSFMAEGTLVQNVGAREYMAIGDSVRITIRP